MPKISFTLNRLSVSAEAEADTLLVDFIRENLGQTGTHLGCDTSQCGACVVFVNGDSVKSCTMLAVQAEGAEVTTVEGLADGGELHPVQAAFHENHALQCGFCTPGILVAAESLLERNADPTETEVRYWLAGNLCRCTGYQQIVEAVEMAAEIKRSDESPSNLTTPSSDPHPVGPDEPSLPPGDAR